MAGTMTCPKVLLLVSVMYLSVTLHMSSGLPPQEAPVMIAEQRKLFRSFLSCGHYPRYIEDLARRLC